MGLWCKSRLQYNCPAYGSGSRPSEPQWTSRKPLMKNNPIGWLVSSDNVLLNDWARTGWLGVFKWSSTSSQGSQLFIAWSLPPGPFPCFFAILFDAALLRRDKILSSAQRLCIRSMNGGPAVLRTSKVSQWLVAQLRPLKTDYTILVGWLAPSPKQDQLGHFWPKTTLHQHTRIFPLDCRPTWIA